jgi:predicted dinucleotide-binding enzyme
VNVTTPTPLSVVIVGAGNVGTALATNLRSLGHDVRVARRPPHGDGEIDLDGAAIGADITILAVPFAAAAEVVGRLGLADGAVLIDATNPFGQPLPDGVSTGAALIAHAAGDGVHVVKAFNVLGAEHMAAPTLPDGHRPLLPVAADDDDARHLVVGLADDMGFDSVEIRGLDNAGLLEEAARYWGLLAFNGGLGRDLVLVAHHRPSAVTDPA